MGFGQLKEVAQRPSEPYLPSVAVPLMAECLHDFQQACSCFVCHLHTHQNAQFTTSYLSAHIHKPYMLNINIIAPASGMSKCVRYLPMGMYTMLGNDVTLQMFHEMYVKRMAVIVEASIVHAQTACTYSIPHGGDHDVLL